MTARCSSVGVSGALGGTARISAIREAEKCLANAEHDELLTLCSDIRDAQLAEIAQMQDWLQEWYDLPGGRPVGTA